jgi:hypothetical protein
VPAREVPGTGACERPPLDAPEERVVDKVLRGDGVSRRDRPYACGAVKKGWLIDHGHGHYSIAPEPKTDPDWIWLPNEIVTGARDETPPLELVRQTQDAMTLRMLVDFYHAQNLREDGGVGRQFTYQEYERFEVGRQAQFTIWGFRYKYGAVTWKGPTACHRRENLTAEEKAAGKNEGIDFFRRQEQLTDLGLIEWVPHLFESGDPSAEIIHPVGISDSRSLDDRLGDAAHMAGLAMLTDRQREWSDEKGLRLVPVPRHIANVQMIGVARLRYRPHTRITAAWWADLSAKGERFIARYAALANGTMLKSANL